MNEENVFAMPFSRLYPLYVAKAERRKGAKQKSKRSSAGYADTAKRS